MRFSSVTIKGITPSNGRSLSGPPASGFSLTFAITTPVGESLIDAPTLASSCSNTTSFNYFIYYNTPTTNVFTYLSPGFVTTAITGATTLTTRAPTTVVPSSSSSSSTILSAAVIAVVVLSGVIFCLVLVIFFLRRRRSRNTELQTRKMEQHITELQTRKMERILLST